MMAGGALLIFAEAACPCSTFASCATSTSYEIVRPQLGISASMTLLSHARCSALALGNFICVTVVESSVTVRACLSTVVRAWNHTAPNTASFLGGFTDTAAIASSVTSLNDSICGWYTVTVASAFWITRGHVPSLFCAKALPAANSVAVARANVTFRAKVRMSSPLDQSLEQNLHDVAQRHHGEQQRKHRRHNGEQERKCGPAVDGEDAHVHHALEGSAQVGHGLDVARTEHLLAILRAHPFLLETPHVLAAKARVFPPRLSLGSRQRRREHEQGEKPEQDREHGDADDGPLITLDGRFLEKDPIGGRRRHG